MGNIFRDRTVLTGGTSGALDAIDGGVLVDGDTANVKTSNGVYCYHLNATSGATENSPYVISPDTNAGTKRWILIIPKTPFSDVYAQQSTLQTVSTDTPTTLICQTETTDVLSEYNNTTGEFTATHAGKYLVTASIITESVDWTSTEFCVFFCYIDAVLFNQGERNYPTGTSRGACSYTSIVPLAASEVLTLRLNHNQGGDVDTGAGNGTWISIDRVK